MNLKSRHFLLHTELCNFVNDAGNSVTAVTAIVFDAASGNFVLFYT